jgi:ABC-type multidrug transport system permease subunit
MVATVILFIHFWKWIILAALLTMGVLLMVNRLRELTG